MHGMSTEDLFYDTERIWNKWIGSWAVINYLKLTSPPANWSETQDIINYLATQSWTNLYSHGFTWVRKCMHFRERCSVESSVNSWWSGDVTARDTTPHKMQQPSWPFLTGSIVHTVKKVLCNLQEFSWCWRQMRKQCAVVDLSETLDWCALKWQVPEEEKEYEWNVLSDTKTTSFLHNLWLGLSKVYLA